MAPSEINKGFCNNPKASLLLEEVSLPAAVLQQSKLENNQNWMRQFAQRSGVLLAPHGKTTMAPELYKLQLANGSWGISLATSQQVRAAYESGIKRIILANQLIGRANMEVVEPLVSDPECELFCFVDSLENAQQLNEFFASRSCSLNVLLEVGVAGGRCGVRKRSHVEILASQITAMSHLNLCGIAFYEGVISDQAEGSHISEFLLMVKEWAQNLHNNGLFCSQAPIISGAGSAWYDLVAKHLADLKEQGFQVVLRPGCYLIHDTGIYQQAQSQVTHRSAVACTVPGELTSSLQVWAYVQSVPEPQMAIVGMGKRDVAFDAGLPIPQMRVPKGSGKLQNLTTNFELSKIMDQHAMLRIPEDSDIAVGDIIVFSTSHPCLTIDKWRYVGLIDDNYVVQGHIETFF